MNLQDVNSFHSINSIRPKYLTTDIKQRKKLFLVFVRFQKDTIHIPQTSLPALNINAVLCDCNPTKKWLESQSSQYDLWYSCMFYGWIQKMLYERRRHFNLCSGKESISDFCRFKQHPTLLQPRAFQTWETTEDRWWIQLCTMYEHVPAF